MKTTPKREQIYEFIEMYVDTPEPKKLCSSIEDLVEELAENKVKKLALSGVIKWVACKDAIPTHQTDVITYSKEFEVRNGRCMQASSWFVDGYPKLVNVTHWAELPKPPCL